MNLGNMDPACGRPLVTDLVSWLPWVLAVPLVSRFRCRYPVAQWHRFSTWRAHLLTCVAIGLISSAWLALLIPYLNLSGTSRDPTSFARLWVLTFCSRFLSMSLLYFFVLALGSVLDSQEGLALQQIKTTRLDQQPVKTKHNVVIGKIEPHCLFPTLKDIEGLVKEKRNEEAVNLIVQLSDSLRRLWSDFDSID